VPLELSAHGLYVAANEWRASSGNSELAASNCNGTSVQCDSEHCRREM